MTTAGPDETLGKIYRKQLLELFHHPLGTGPVPPEATEGAARNRTCGDVVTFHALQRGAHLAECRQRTSGCAIATATASLLTTHLEGLRLDEAFRLLEQIRTMIETGSPARLPDDLRALAGVHPLPSRHECVGVALDAAAACLRALGTQTP